MDYAIANQRDRRNLDDRQLASLVMNVDKRKQTGGDRKSEEAKSMFSLENIDSGRSHVATAELAGTSPTQVSKIRAIVNYADTTGDTEEKDAVLRGRAGGSSPPTPFDTMSATTRHCRASIASSMDAGGRRMRVGVWERWC